MSDYAALIAEAREMVALWERERGMGWRNDWLMHVVRLADALEAVQQTPAVDREALARVMTNTASRSGVNWYHQQTAEYREPFLRFAEAIIASGILLDAAEVEARGLSEFADWFVNTSSTVGGKPMFTGSEVAEILRGPKPFGMAQQVREGN